MVQNVHYLHRLQREHPLLALVTPSKATLVFLVHSGTGQVSNPSYVASGKREYFKCVCIHVTDYNGLLSLSSSMTQEVIALRESLRLRTRKKEATTSCMPEPHQETSSTTTSSPSAAFATSAKCWIRRDPSALLVRF